jgi:hypothetical protein
LHVKEKGERVRSTPPTARCFGGRQWWRPGETKAAARARMERCGVLAGAKKKVQGLELEFYRGEGGKTAAKAMGKDRPLMAVAVSI